MFLIGKQYFVKRQQQDTFEVVGRGVALVSGEAVDDPRLLGELGLDQVGYRLDHSFATFLLSHLVLEVAPVETVKEIAKGKFF